MRFILRSLVIIPLLIGAWVAPLSAAEEAPAAEPAATEAAVAPDAGAEIDGDTTDSTKNDEGFLSKFYSSGGLIAKILTGLLILSIGLMLERIVNLTRSNLAPVGFTDEAKKLWASGNQDGLIKLCENDGSTLASVAEFLSKNRDATYEEINEGASEIAGRELRKQLQTNYWLSVIATLSPLLGLLGTIIGMILSFEEVAVAGDIGDIGTVAGGISAALFTTAGGLVVAIPSLGAFHFFKGRVTQLGIQLEDASTELIRAWFGSAAKND